MLLKRPADGHKGTFGKVLIVGGSTGFSGAPALAGLSALLTMLNSCASGVTVVNIDNGFDAAYAASMINMKIGTRKR